MDCLGNSKEQTERLQQQNKLLQKQIAAINKTLADESAKRESTEKNVRLLQQRLGENLKKNEHDQQLKELKEQLEKNLQELKKVKQEFEEYRAKYKRTAYQKAVGEKYATLTTKTGLEFSNVTLTKVDAASVYFLHDKGAAKLSIPEFGDEWITRFAYDPLEAKELLEKESAAKLLAVDTLTIKADPDSIKIVSAVYGADDSWWDVKQILQNKINSGQFPIRIGGSTFGGDPIFGRVKTLVVSYSYKGQMVKQEYRDGDKFFSEQGNTSPRARRQDEETSSIPVVAQENNDPSSAFGNGPIIRSKRPFSIRSRR